MSGNVRFEPSPKQMKFADIYLDLSRKTNEDMAKEVGVSDRTIYRWFNNPDFVKWINTKKDEILDRSLMDRYKTAIRKAKSGDFQFSKMLFEMQNEYIPKSESKVINVKDDLDNLTMQELIRELEHDINIYRERHKTESKVTKADKEE